jgi:glucuronoarabinoxylan endo-1,4-beta-xylanase
VDYYKKVHGLTVDVLSLQNEPDISVFWESCRWTGEELRDFLKVLAPAFRERGLSTKFMLSEGSSWDQAWMRVEPSLRDPQTRGSVGILASHSYGDDDLVDRGRDLFRAASEQFKIPVWTSEMSSMGAPDDPGMNTALKIAHLMYLDITRGGAGAWIYCFTIFTPEFPGSMGVLSPATKQGRLVVPKRFWAMANYSHFIRPGWKRIQIDGLGFANSAFISPEGDRFAIVALNASLMPRPALYYFGAWRISSVQAHLTSQDSDLSPTFVTKVEPNHFEMNLPPRSVTTITGRLQANVGGN